MQVRRPADPKRLLSAISLALVLTGCGGGGSSETSTLQQASVTISMYPTSSTLPVGARQQFKATVVGSTAVLKWTATSGSVDDTGLYVAPQTVPTDGTAIISAVVSDTPSVSASATVTITGGQVTLSLSPASARVKAGLSQQFVATVGGTSNTDTVWTAVDSPGESDYPGSVFKGLYTAPAPVFGQHNFVVTAASAADPSKTASAAVTVVPLENQQAQEFPIKLATSGGNARTGDCCSGTLGSLVADQNGKQYILSNNHVIGRMGNAVVGEDIIQPGLVDTYCDSSVSKTVAHFTAAPSIDNSNVDAAIAEVVPGAVDPKGTMIGLGGEASDGTAIAAAPASTTTLAVLNMIVAKSGRTTGLTCGSVVGLYVTANLQVSPVCGNPVAKVVTLTGQIVLTNLVSPGDSGSLILGATTAQPVALISGLGSDYDIASPAADVLNALQVTTGLTFSFVGGGQHQVPCPGTTSAMKSAARQPAALKVERVLQAKAAKETHERDLLRDPAVFGVGVGGAAEGSGEAAVLVFVERGKKPASIPAALEGVPVRMIEAEPFRTAVVGPRSSVVSKGKCKGN